MATTVKQAQDAYIAAKAKGDQAAMAKAHADAEAARAQQGYSGGADGSQHIALSSGTTSGTSSVATPAAPNYVPIGTWNDRTLPDEDKQKIEYLQKQSQAAQQRGDKAAMATYHDQAEAIRAKYDYSGNTDGSDFIGLDKQDPNTTGNQNISNYSLADYNLVNSDNIHPEKAGLTGLPMGDLYGITYDKDTILNLLNEATKTQYDSQRQGYQETIDDFYNQMSSDQASLLDTLRKSQANAVATGASKGMAAAQELSTILGLQDTTAESATDLGNAKNKLDAEEAAAYAANANTALDTSNTIKQAIAGLDSTKYGYDTQSYVGEMDYASALKAVLGEIIQSQNSANATIANGNANLEGTKYAADANAANSYKSSYNSNYNGYAAKVSADATPVTERAKTGVDTDEYIKNSDGTYTVYPGGGNKTPVSLTAEGWEAYKREGTLDIANNDTYSSDSVKAALGNAGNKVPTSSIPLAPNLANSKDLTDNVVSKVIVNGKTYIKQPSGQYYQLTNGKYNKASDPFADLRSASTPPSSITIGSNTFKYSAKDDCWYSGGDKVSAKTVATYLNSGANWYSWTK